MQITKNLIQKVQNNFNHQQSKFKAKYTPQERIQKRIGIQAKFYQDKNQLICIVLQKYENSKLKNFTKPFILFGIDKELTLFELRRHIQKILSLSDKQSLIIVCRSQIPNTNQKIKELEVHKQNDGFLYLLCSELDVFG